MILVFWFCFKFVFVCVLAVGGGCLFVGCRLWLLFLLVNVVLS